uniref:Major facilitator superfamily (MFS) profile domain-containing protein n=1 Tax=Oryza nivara TaxID=4536 RepID=A0A0E0H9L1_ORYNI
MRWKLKSSAYKRVPSRDAAMDLDVETPAKMADGGAPSWRMSLPHVGSIADGIGRRRAFQLSALPMIIGAAVSALTNSLEGMLLGRFLVGTGMGLGPPVASLYITEVSPPSVRGTYGSFVQIATCLGIVVSLLIGTPVKDIDRWWRVCFWVAAVPATLQALGMEFCAESPQWLYKCGRTTEAEIQFEKLLGPLHVKSAMAELSRSERGDDGENVKYSELFYGRNFNVVFIGTTLFALQQLSGINSVFYFSSTVFRSVGVPPNLANICMGIANLSGSIVAMLLMDKLGRKVLLSGSFLGMAFAMGLQAVGANRHHLGSASVYLSVGGMLLFVLTFSLGAGPVPGLLLPEIFPNKIRAKAMALCMSVHWFVVLAASGATWSTSSVHNVFLSLCGSSNICAAPYFISEFEATTTYMISI